MFDNWPGWETVRLIGQGSFGSVYEIRRNMFGDEEKAALKVISIPQNASDIAEMYNDGYDDESITSVFRNHLESIVAEYTLMRKMNGSANIVNCDDIRYVQHSDGIGWDIFIKMELLRPLPEVMPPQISEKMVIKVAKDMCAALELCRKHNIVHRDIKPQNIMVSDNGDFKLGDFGIAKTVEKTTGGTKIGTYKYMAPEVYHNRPYGAAADIYSLGLVLYWMLNERRMPFLPLPPEKLKPGMEESARNHRLSGAQLPPPLHGSEKLKGIVLKACAYDPKDRFDSAQEMLEALGGHEQSVVTQSTVPPVVHHSHGQIQRQSDGTQENTEYTQKMWSSTGYSGNGHNGTVTRKIPNQTVKTPGTYTSVQVNRNHFDNQYAEPRRPRYGLWIGLAVAFVIVGVLALVLLVSFMSDRLDWDFLQEKPGSTSTAGPSRDDEETGEHTHRWTDATCTTPKTCRTCGKTSGSASGHNWTDAACDMPKTCRTCGETDGSASGHNWTDATCDAPRTCRTCGETDGTARGHSWRNATYDTPKTCSVCGKTEGVSLMAEQLQFAEVGDIITFGAYEQDNNFSNGKEEIEWIVLEKTSSRIFVISRYALDHQSFHTSLTAVTWENCYLRQWLNDSFLNTAFTEQERAMIPTVTVSADWNPMYNNHPGNSTQDRIYILSTSEAEHYFPFASDRICYATKYTESNSNVWVNGSIGSVWWWLRTPGENQTDATTVNTDGRIDFSDGQVNSVTGTVRPVLWINIS